jgi:hypothetical protein
LRGYDVLLVVVVVVVVVFITLEVCVGSVHVAEGSDAIEICGCDIRDHAAGKSTQGKKSA